MINMCQKRRNKINASISAIVCFLFLTIFWGYYIYSNVPIIYELGDEYEYIWNAAHIIGVKIPDVYSGFYGIGYSIFLIIPLMICKSSLNLIYSCYIVNMCFALGIYIVLIVLMTRINSRLDWKIPIACMIACLSPYLSSNICKVFGENCLAFFFVISVLLFYEFVRSNKIIYAILNVCCVAYMYFIHTRAVGVVICYLVFYVAYCIKERRISVKVILPIIVLVFFIGLFQYCKLIFVQYKQAAITSDVLYNVVSKDFMEERLLWLFYDLKNYIYCFLCKLLYVAISTCGLFFFWIVNRVETLIKIIKKKENITSEEFIYQFMLVCFLVILIETTIVGTGNTISYMFYGRYYEFLIPVMFGVMLNPKDLADTHVSQKKMCFFLLVIVLTIKATMVWALNEFGNGIVKLDTNRLDVFSAFLKKEITVATLFVAIGVCLLFFVLISQMKKKYILYEVAFLFLICISRANLDEISNIHSRGSEDYELVKYIVENIDEKVWIIDNASYIYPNFYSRIAVYLYNNDFEIIKEDENIRDINNMIEPGDFYLLYANDEELNDMNGGSIIYTGDTMTLYKK